LIKSLSVINSKNIEEMSNYLEKELKNQRDKNCNGDTNEMIFDKAIRLLTARDVRRNGPICRKVFSSIHTINERYHYYPEVAGDLIANIVSISHTSKELVRNFNNIETVLRNFEDSDIIYSLNRDVMENFENIFEDKFRKLIDIPTSTKGSFREFLNNFRDPKVIFKYYGKIKEIPKVKKVFIEDFVIPNMEGNFYKKIYSQSDSLIKGKSHFSIVFNDRPELLEKWKKQATVEIKAKAFSNQIKLFTLTQTKNSYDMFMLGTETHSCQDVDGNPKFNKCLMGYVLNPCTQAIVIKSKDTGKIAARSIIRMLWDKEKRQPVLLLEKNYKKGLAPVKYEQMITNFAISRAKEMGLPIISKEFSNFSKDKYNGKVVSYDSGKAPFEYCDSANGVTDGKYVLTQTFNLLYSPKFERERKSFKSNISNEIEI
jgi:hypothetical protein